MRTKTLPPKEQMLQRLTIFRGLAPKELGEVARLVDEVRRPAGWVLMREGQSGKQGFIIAEGTATVTINGEEVAKIGPGDTVGEMALLDALPRSATVVADTDISVLVLSPHGLWELLGIPTVARVVVRTLVARLRKAEGAPEHW